MLQRDRAYWATARHARLEAQGITAVGARPKSPHGSGLGTSRWGVERTLAWLHRLRRVALRYERRADVHLDRVELPQVAQASVLKHTLSRTRFLRSVSARTYAPTERLMAFSRKGRGFCPSCGGRRMTERAAHLVDHVWPEVPIRQWVLTLPPRVRYALAWRRDLCTAVAGMLFHAVQRHLRTWAQMRRLGDARSGAIIVVQRFGGALNLNVHLHALVLDGVFARAGDGQLRFHRAPPPSAADVADVLAAIAPPVRARLARAGLDDEDGADSHAGAEPALVGLAAASVQGVLALGGVSGRRPQRLGRGEGRIPESALLGPRPDTPGARWDGFDLHGGVTVPGHRARLERLCRYVLRPPVTGAHLAVAADGRVVLRLRHPWADGTTHVVFEPTEFLERLAALVPRPRINLLLYRGVLAPHAAWRADSGAGLPGSAAPAGAESNNAAATSPWPAGRR